MKILLLIIFIFSGYSFAQERKNSYTLEKSQTVAEIDPSETARAKIQRSRQWPIRLNKFEINPSQSHYELDVVNMFGNQMTTNTPRKNQIAFKAFVKLFTNYINFTYYHRKTKVGFNQKADFTIDQQDYYYFDRRFGLNFIIGHFELETGYGKHKTHTFLETDTTKYYTFELNNNYGYIDIRTIIPTPFYIKLKLSFLNKLYLNQEVESYKLEKGRAREWSLGLVLGSTFQFGPYVTYGYENYKFVHKFFGLENEMMHKLHYQNYGIYTSYRF